MIRKNSVLLLVAVMSLFALASCDLLAPPDDDDPDLPKECEHTFSDSWSTSATEHWHAATCEHGENKSALGAHTDEDEDGLCDVCAYEVGHEHTFDTAWETDDNKHWHKATCTHTDLKIDEGLHKDDNTDGVCEECDGHVHILDFAGFCTGCGEEVDPVLETELDRVIAAATLREGKVKLGNIIYSMIGRNLTEDTENTMDYSIYYLFGTNGLYTVRTEDEVRIIGVYPNAYAELTGEDLLTENWIPLSSDEIIVGVTASSVNGKYVDAQFSAFSQDDLRGFYYPVSTLADGYGTAEILYNLYAKATSAEASNLNVTHDPDANSYFFSFEYVGIHETKIGEELHYNVSAFYTEITFTYSDDYVITSLDIDVDCYTSDPGADRNGKIYEADIDLEYDPATGKVTWRENATPDSYSFKVTQEIGEREELEMNDGSEFCPDDFDVTFEGSSVEQLEILVGDNEKEFLITATPEESFFSFLKNDFKVTVTAKGDAPAKGLSAILVGDVIQLFPYVKGEYVVTCTALGITKTVEVTVTAPEIPGTGSFEVVANDNNTFEGNLVVFKAEKAGTYTFHLPANLGVWLKTSYDSNGGPLVDPGEPFFDATIPRSFTYTFARAGQTLSFYIKVPVKGVPYVIGYEVADPA